MKSSDRAALDRAIADAKAGGPEAVAGLRTRMLWDGDPREIGPVVTPSGAVVMIAHAVWWARP